MLPIRFGHPRFDLRKQGGIKAIPTLDMFHPEAPNRTGRFTCFHPTTNQK
jgi:hypothetical protein